jgi:cell filamentation protein
MLDKYGTGHDPYCYKNSTALINRFNITDDSILQDAEREISSNAYNSIQFRCPPYDLNYLKNIHFQLFSKIYEWAGKIRTIDISKGDTRFCIVSRIEPEANKIFKKLSKSNFFVELSANSLVNELAELYGDLNMIHPFREGNGRTQRILFEHITWNCNYNLNWSVASKDEWVKANIESVNCDYSLLEKIFNNALCTIA